MSRIATTTRTARASKARKVIALTPAQKAAATKRINGMDLSAIAVKANATRIANIETAARAARSAARSAARAASKALISRSLINASRRA